MEKRFSSDACQPSTSSALLTCAASIRRLFATVLPVVLARHPSNVGAESLFSHASLVLTKRPGNLSREMASTLSVLHYDGYKVIHHFVADAKASKV